MSDEDDVKACITRHELVRPLPAAVDSNRMRVTVDVRVDCQ